MKYMKLKNQDELREMEKEWHTHIQENLQITTARGYVSAARMALYTQRKVRAKRLYEEAIATGNANSRTYFLYGHLLEDMDDPKGARENWRKAIEADPLVSDYYIALARRLIEDEDHWEEGEQLLKLSHDIDPDNFFLERNLEALLRNAAKYRRRQAEKKADEEEEDDDEEDEGAAEGEADEK